MRIDSLKILLGSMQRFLRNLSQRTDDGRTDGQLTTDACATTVALLTKSSKAKNQIVSWNLLIVERKLQTPWFKLLGCLGFSLTFFFLFYMFLSFSFFLFYIYLSMFLIFLYIFHSLYFLAFFFQLISKHPF